MKLFKEYYLRGITCCYIAQYKSFVMLPRTERIIIASSKPKHNYGPGAHVVLLCKQFLWIKKYYIVGYLNKKSYLLGGKHE